MQWYYADAQRVQYGPMNGNDLVAAFRAGKLKPSSLIWRDGMTDWKPLSQCAHELGLHDTDLYPGNETISLSTPPAAAAGLPRAAAEHNPYNVPSARVEQNSFAAMDENAIVYAGFWKRFAANFIDSFLIAIAMYAVLIPVMFIFGMTDPQNMFENGEPSPTYWVVNIFSNLFSFAVGITYYAWMESSSYQATLGKQIIGIKVCDFNGGRISFWRAVGRYFGRIISTLTLGIGLIMAGFTDRKMALHDYIASTLVVDKHAFTHQAALQKSELGGCTIAIIVVNALILLFVLFAVFALFAAIGSSGLRW
jgi:uncharacterized RDD family membrane protein YckC